MGKRRKQTGFRVLNFDRPMRDGRFYKRPDRVKDPKTAFFYLMDNVEGQNSGKLLSDMAARGDYHWIERDRNSDQCYFIVRKRGNHVIVTRRRWVVNGEGVNTFIGMFTGYESEPIREDTIVLRHPIMDIHGFKKAYAEAAPELNHWED